MEHYGRKGVLENFKGETSDEILPQIVALLELEKYK